MKELVRETPLAKPAFALLERVKALRGLRNPSVGDDGLPLPPPLLMTRVVGHADADAFQSYGHEAATLIQAASARHGLAVGPATSVLDFGCGCGRVARHWPRLDGPGVVHGADLDPAAVEWCNRNLPFVDAVRTSLTPPTRYAEAQFDLVYALSVITHLDESTTRAWVAELRRILTPGGLLFLTTKGDRHAQSELPSRLLERYRAGEFVAVDVAGQGSNLCASYVNEAWVTSHLPDGLELLEHADLGHAMMGGQDAYVLRRARA